MSYKITVGAYIVPDGKGFLTPLGVRPCVSYYQSVSIRFGQSLHLDTCQTLIGPNLSLP